MDEKQDSFEFKVEVKSEPLDETDVAEVDPLAPTPDDYLHVARAAASSADLLNIKPVKLEYDRIASVDECCSSPPSTAGQMEIHPIKQDIEIKEQNHYLEDCFSAPFTHRKNNEPDVTTEAVSEGSSDLNGHQTSIETGPLSDMNNTSSSSIEADTRVPDVSSTCQNLIDTNEALHRQHIVVNNVMDDEASSLEIEGRKDVGTNTNQDDRPFACQFCNYKASIKMNLTRHVKMVHKDVKTLGCDDTDIDGDTLKQCKAIKLTGPKSYDCKICEYKTTVMRDLSQHVQVVHRGLKLHSCLHCDYKHGKKSRLARHSRTVHQGIKPFSCTYCCYKASLKSAVEKHVRSVHQNIKPFSCEHCCYKAGVQSMLKKHVETIHLSIRPYPCTLCYYKADVKSRLKKHIETVHQGIKPHSCPHCDFKTSETSNLKQHIKIIHQGIKPYSCKQCDYKAGVKSKLKRHEQSVHRFT